jgi:hypothetical protein
MRKAAIVLITGAGGSDANPGDGQAAQRGRGWHRIWSLPEFRTNECRKSGRPDLR